MARYVVVDDDLSDSSWEQDMYRLAAAPAEIIFASVRRACDRVDGWCLDEVRTMVLSRDIGTMRCLGEAGVLDGREVNLGGLHSRAGRRRWLSYLYVTEGDVADLLRLQEMGAAVSARDLPETAPVALAALAGR